MGNLTNPKRIREIMKQYDKHFSKALGQNFLIEESVLDEIVTGSGIDRDVCVLEIGPGIGVLTEKLAQNAKKVVAVEIDDQLIPVLADTMGAFDNVTVVHSDIMKCDLNELIQSHFKGERVKVAANLPYYITTPIVMRLLESRQFFESITVMVQKEVAQRFDARPGGKEYGAISVAVQYFTDTQILTHVPPECFMPAPKVTSSVIKMEVRAQPKAAPKDEKLFFQLVKASFAQRRKTLVNGISNGGLGFTKEQVANALESMGLDKNIRGERLSIQEFADLSDLLGIERK